MEKNKISLILDSGAFSAWTRRVAIDIDEYIKFSLENIEHIDYVVNLDVIPGFPGDKNITEDKKEASAAAGYENYYYMLKKGIPKEKLIHVFHMGEDMKWLRKMVDEIPYIGLSPANDRRTPEKIIWLDKCMPIVCDNKGTPKVKFHGFAVTALPIMLRYPWYSVDSTTWVIHARNGAIIMPRFKDDKWVYDEKAWLISVSEKSPDLKEAGKHYTTLSPERKKIIDSYIKEKGYSIDELASDYKKRDEINILYYLDLEKALPKWPWAFKLKSNSGFGL